ncbi:MAG: DNA-3-methyladenine glycosylase 2 family protein [Pelagibacteraceae bacterium]|nr:DNA-3-methyladenine glycosylase 2 family protein [Pelagibacteraceae bacterium]MCI5079994.1 DNA-3-methyladenine glycosylase 2 family protein [Pelagibacteraceae bacterium]
MTKPKYWEQGKKYLVKKDKILGKLIKKYPGYLKSRKDPFFSLCKSIVGQQISVQAANSVWKKFEAKSKKIKPENVLKLSSRQLSSCGLSRQKILYLKILAKKFKTKEINISKLKKMDDHEAINHLTTVKGIGKWTAEMFLFFNQLRPDIFPVQDIGLLRAISINYKTSYPPKKNQLNRFQKKWSPYCTVATWYLWRSIDPVVVSY